MLVGEEGDGNLETAYYSRPGLAYYLTGELPEKLLFPFSRSDFQKLRVRFHRGRVEHLYPEWHQVEADDGRRIGYEQLLIATGARAAGLQVDGIDARGVVKLDCLDDAQKIMRRARSSRPPLPRWIKPRSGVVVGGGITALEIIEGLVAQGVKVHYFLRGDHYWSNVLDEAESRIIEHRLKEEGVQIHYQTELAEILHEKDSVTGVKTKAGQMIPCDMVAVAIGILPRRELAQDAGIKIDRGVLVDEYLRTSEVDIFAAGDVAQVYDPLTKKSVLDSLWGPARQQGFTAGRNMAACRLGKPLTAYEKGIAFNVTRLANLTTTIIGTVGGGRDNDLIGIARGDSEVWRQLPDAIAAQSGFDVNRLRLMVGEKTLVGAVVMGNQTLSRPLQHLVAEQIDITSICGDLLAPQVDIAEVIADFWCQYQGR